jgi:hypothetical protein
LQDDVIIVEPSDEEEDEFDLEDDGFVDFDADDDVISDDEDADFEGEDDGAFSAACLHYLIMQQQQQQLTCIGGVLWAFCFCA